MLNFFLIFFPLSWFLILLELRFNHYPAVTYMYNFKILIRIHNILNMFFAFTFRLLRLKKRREEFCSRVEVRCQEDEFGSIGDTLESVTEGTPRTWQKPIFPRSLKQGQAPRAQPLLARNLLWVSLWGTKCSNIRHLLFPLPPSKMAHGPAEPGYSLNDCQQWKSYWDP